MLYSRQQSRRNLCVNKKVVENHIEVVLTETFTDVDSSGSATANDTMKLAVKLTNDSWVALSNIKITDAKFAFNATHASLAKEANVTKEKIYTLLAGDITAGVLSTVLKITANEFDRPLFVAVDFDLKDYPEEG